MFFLYISLPLLILPNLSFSLLGANVKAYMVIGLLYLSVYIGKLRFSKLFYFEYLLLFVYLIIGFSVIYACDYKLALKLLIGQVVLVLVYISYRSQILKLGLSDFESAFFNVGKLFIFISMLLYVMGLVGLYFFDIVPSKAAYLNDHAAAYFGVYLEGSLPRLKGLSESPNNYMYFAFSFMLFFRYKRKAGFEYLSLLTIILTISGTALVSLLFYYAFLFFNSQKNIAYKIFIPLFVFLFGQIVYLSNGFIRNIVDIRVQRLGTGSGRFELWNFVINKVVNSPLLGYGANQARVVIEPFRELQSAHNSFLDVFLSTGIIGFFAYILFHLSLLITSIQLGRKYSTGMFIVMYGFIFLISMSNNTLHIDYMVFYLCIIYAYSRNQPYKPLEKIDR